MTLYFATCERRRAWEFWQRMNPGVTEAQAKPLLDLVEADIIRVTDPEYHNHKACAIIGGNNWSDERKAEVNAAARAAWGGDAA